jgi:hypothetical protein
MTTILPKDSVTHAFSYLDFPTLCRLPLVCKQWLFVQELVFEYIKSRQEIEGIIKPLINDEKKWRWVAECPSIPFKRFQELPQLTQSIYLWKGISVDSTPLFKLLIDKIKEVACEGMEQPCRFFMDPAGLFHDAKADHVLARRETQLLFSLAENPISPFNHHRVRSHFLEVAAPAVPVFYKIIAKTRKLLGSYHQKK